MQPPVSADPNTPPDDEDFQVAPAEQVAPREMRFWPALGWSALILVTLVGVQLVVFVPFLVVRMVGRPPADLERVVTELEHDGTVLAVATGLTTLVCVLVVALIVRISGWNVREYLRLSWPKNTWHVVASFLLVIGFLVLSDGLTYLMQRDVVPEFMLQAYESAALPVLIFAVVIAAPIGEEVIFRGFMIRSFSSSAGPLLAIVISAAVWAVIHLQYDWYGITTVFLGGLLLGGIYYRTSSLSLCVVLHAFWNLIATLEVVVYVNYMRP